MSKCGYQVCCQSCRLKVTKAGLPNSKFHRQHLRCLVLNSVASTETRQTLACEWFDRFDYGISTISTILYDSMNILNIIKHQIMSNHTDIYHIQSDMASHIDAIAQALHGESSEGGANVSASFANDLLLWHFPMGLYCFFGQP